MAVSRVASSLAEFEEQPVTKLFAELGSDEMSDRMNSVVTLLDAWRESGGRKLEVSERFRRVQRVLVDLVDLLERETKMQLFDSRGSTTMGEHVADSRREGPVPPDPDARKKQGNQRRYCSLSPVQVAAKMERAA